MKKNKNLRLALIIIGTILLACISFIGIYVKEDFNVVNHIKGYKLGMELSEKRVVSMKVDDSVKSITTENDEEENTENAEDTESEVVEEKVNPDEVLTLENYKKVKKMLSKRLRGIGQEEYEISLNKENGEIVIELPENDETNNVISILSAKGVINITDSETGEVLLNNDNIKKTSATANAVDAENIVLYLKVEFNKEGSKKLDEISKIYVKTVTQEENEEGELEDKESVKNISVLIDGTEYSKS